MNNKVTEYIRGNWTKTFRSPSELSGDFKIDHPFVSPCVADIYMDMYYWDTYFLNLGLYLDGHAEQAENNVDNIAKFIKRMGYMPNANHLTDRSQPPFFTRMVYDLYKFKNDKTVIEKYIDVVIKEHDFWKRERTNEIGLSSYGDSATKEQVLDNYNGLRRRVLEDERETESEKLILGHDIMAIAESGLDFNMRFRTPTSKVCAHEFSHLDLDCILLDAEDLAFKMLKTVGREKEAEEFAARAKARKELMDKYYRNPQTGIYMDYNIKTGEFSKVLSAISLYPYTFGVSDDQKSALEVLSRLEYEYGISACEFRGEDIYYQWDYPCMWPAATCLIYMGLKRIGLFEAAKRVAEKYVSTVEKIFEKTGRLWEKYDAVTGEVAVTCEYETPPMMGWTAGVYRYFVEEIKKF